jgi:5-methylcytosine-specific restriction protein B
MSVSDAQPAANASTIREYIRTRYLEPARKRHETLVTLRAGDIHRELGLRNRVPNVCQVMESKLLEKEAGVKVSSKQGYAYD